MSHTTRVAVACQGGGTHTAFSAGAFRELLRHEDDDFEIVALSGTSGGAMTAALTWYSLLEGDRQAGVERLAAFWRDVAATTPSQRFENELVTATIGLQARGAPIPRVAPAQNPYATTAQQRLREIIERHVDFDAIDDLRSDATPELYVGAVEIESDDFTLFQSGDITPDALLASAALPTMFEPVEIDGREYWDGLLSENPPIGCLAAEDPEEIWVLQHDPERRDGATPSSLGEIRDRRNELAGNVSVDQEINSIQRINRMIADGDLQSDRYNHIDVHRLMMDREFDYATKFDRSPEFLEQLIEYGEEVASDFLADR